MKTIKLKTNTWYHSFIIARELKWYEKLPFIGWIFDKSIDFLYSKKDKPDLPKGYTKYRKICSSKDFKKVKNDVRRRKCRK